jgi:hypothetical protein
MTHDLRGHFRDFWQLLRDCRIGRLLRDSIGRIERYDENVEICGYQNHAPAQLRTVAECLSDGAGATWG